MKVGKYNKTLNIWVIYEDKDCLILHGSYLEKNSIIFILERFDNHDLSNNKNLRHTKNATLIKFLWENKIYYTFVRTEEIKLIEEYV